MDNAGKVALVTGANKGIGREITRQLGEHRFTVLAGARDEHRGRAAAAELSGSGADIRYVPLDVTDEGSIADIAAYAEKEFGRLDVLVNNAAISLEKGRPVLDIPVDEVRAMFETNVIGVVALIRATLPLLRKARGRVINLSSGLGSVRLLADPDGPDMGPDVIGYSASKAALNMVTVLYSRALRDEGIAVNAVSPGWVATDLTGHQGFRTAEQGAAMAVRTATSADIPTGTFLNDNGAMTW
jgi:NAD(P)-dependent dehydrogenase (short-subunit alcohol dehydrogenase family)